MVKDEIIELLNIFTGADGGISFIKFRTSIEQFEQDALNGDLAAAEILKRFSQVVNMVKCLGEYDEKDFEM